MGLYGLQAHLEVVLVQPIMLREESRAITLVNLVESSQKLLEFGEHLWTDLMMLNQVMEPQNSRQKFLNGQKMKLR